MPRQLLLATRNDGKVREIRELIGVAKGAEILSAADFPEIPEPFEDGATFMDNARSKALCYAEQSGLLSLADDSGLIVDALGGRPGVMSARYAPTSAERNNKLLVELEGIGDNERTARFVCAMALARPGRIAATAKGVLEGTIERESRGSHGFGYDPVFHVAELGCALAEAPAAIKNTISHRAKALQAMLPLLLRELGITP